ncbi:MAG: response regulator [Deltaproteobacteria bacterium]|nr:response regulator [Deltaproteobacteria bacterium]
MTTVPARVLCVDDEPKVLEGLQRTLGLVFDVETATSGAEGLEKVILGNFDVVVSDMRMPNMDGAAFLSKAKERAPDTERILLTGQADLRSTVAAINGGGIFRFLSKPCPPDLLERTVQEAIERRRAVLSERELQQATLAATVKTLLQILGMAAPLALRRSSFYGRCARHVTQKLAWPNAWQYEVAAELSQLGQVAIPDAILERSYARMELAHEEKQMVNGHAESAYQLLSPIPRLESVATMIRYQFGIPLQAVVTPEEVRGVRLLQVIGQLERLLGEVHSLKAALPRVKAHFAREFQEIVEALADLPGGELIGTCSIKVSDLRAGMVVDDDVRAKNGLLLLARGAEVSPAMVERLVRFASVVGVKEPLRIRASAGSVPPA